MADHPDDVAARVALLASLIAARHAAGLSQGVLGRLLGISQSAVSNYEQQGTRPLIAHAQRYARAVGRRVALAVVGLPAVDDDPAVTLYRRLAAADLAPDVADAWHRGAIREHLRVVRLRGGLPTRAYADAMGCCANAIRLTEAGRDNPRLTTYQRYARALGGRLDVCLEPLDNKGA